MPESRWRYLLDGRARISPRSLAVLRSAAAAGLKVVLATGRTAVSLARVTAELDFPYHRITNGGAVAQDPGRAPRYTRFLDSPVWPRIVEGLLSEGLSPAVYAHRYPELPEVWIASERGDPHFESYVARNRSLIHLRRDLSAAALDGVVEVAALGSGAAFDTASQRLRERFGALSESHTMVLFIAEQYGKITEFFAPGVSKWSAFLSLFPEAAAAPDAVIAIGDEANDLEMIAGAGLGIAMGNAIAPVKAAARRVTADNDHEGLAEALEPIIAELAGNR